MAIFVGPIDYTFDLALEDAKKAKRLPLAQGVYLSDKVPEGIRFFSYLKTRVYFEGQSDTPWDDMWENTIDWSFVSDWYKDIYGQRPHFDKWYWRGLLGVYQSIVDFKSNEEVMNEKAEMARQTREWMESEAEREYQEYMNSQSEEVV